MEPPLLTLPEQGMFLAGNISPSPGIFPTGTTLLWQEKEKGPLAHGGTRQQLQGWASPQQISTRLAPALLAYLSGTAPQTLPAGHTLADTQSP